MTFPMSCSALLLLLSSLLIISCEPFAARSGNAQQEAVIYGQDTREDVQQANLDSRGSATVMLIHNYRLQPPIKTLRDAYPLCADEAFQDQPRLGFCTGVLIAPDKVLTAGHCFNEKKDCSQISMLLGFTSDKVGKIKKAELYGCTAILSAENSFGPSGMDYAILQLDRKVVGVKPVVVAKDSEVKNQETVSSYSYPLGLPLKKDTGLVHGSDSKNHFFKVDVDTFEGSSGSPLFNSRGELLGILSRGADDILEDDIHRIQTEGGCLNFHRCDNGFCNGETFFKASLVPGI
ncbi:Trypsin [compost metagenome]